MKKTLMLIFGMSVLLLYFSCAPQIKDLKATGDMAEVVFRDRRKLTCELLALTDSSIYVLRKGAKLPSIYYGEVVEIYFRDLRSIAIRGYTNKKWIGAIIAFEVVPAALFAIAAASADADGMGTAIGIMSLPVLLNFAVFSASTPPTPGVKNFYSTGQSKRLRKYARFPQGLTQDQLKQLLEESKQDEIHRLK